MQLAQGDGANDDDAARASEAAAIIKIFEPDRTAHRPHILLGDLHSHAPSPVSTALIDAGYLDTFAACNAESTATLGTYSTQNPTQRFDYIFSHGFAKNRIKEARIEQDRLAKYASDHFPVFAEIEVSS